MNEEEIAIMQKSYNELLVTYQNKEFEKLLIDSKNFFKKYPKNIYGANILALAYKNNGNYEKSIELYKLMMDSGTTEISIYTNAGNTYHSIGKMTESLECHKKALEIDPNSIGSLTGCGLVLSNSGKDDDAIEYYKKIPKIDEKATSAYYNIGNILRNQQKYKEAAKYYSKHPTKISKAQELECYYRIDDIDSYDENLKKFEEKFGSSPLPATISAHASIKYSRKDECNFAPNAFELIEKKDLFELDNFDKNFINEFVSEFNDLAVAKKTQSLIKNGFQSSGNLFLHKKNTFKVMYNLIEKEINAYREKFSKTGYKIFSDWPSDYEIYGWMIMIGNEGSLGAHMHKEGWLSGSIYINIPEKEEGSLEGDIRFSLHGGAYDDGGTEFPEKVENLRTGNMVLFPSSLFHSTIPIRSSKNRITLAFDVRPPDLDIKVE